MATVPMIAIGIIFSGRATSSAKWVAQSRQAKAQLVLISPTIKAFSHEQSSPDRSQWNLALTDPVLLPSGLIDKVRKYKSGGLVRRSFGRDRDQDDEKGDERGVERCGGNSRE